MKDTRKKKKSVKIASIVVAFFLIFSISLLIFATMSRANPNLTLFGYRFYYVLTGSMEPEIRKDSLIVAKETAFEDLKVGDVISFISHDPDIEGMINSHEIFSIDTNDEGIVEITTKGTANPMPDEYKVYKEDIMGRVVYTSYHIGKAFEILSNRTVSFCVTVLPIAIIVLINLIDLFVIINTPEKVLNAKDEKDKQANSSDPADTNRTINSEQQGASQESQE